MFQYIPKSMWFPTSVDVKQVATLEELENLCKSGEVERVVIPFTYYGYGASLIDDSNRRSIAKHYAQNRFKSFGYSLTMSSYQFLKHEDFRELVEELQEREPVFNSEDYSELESETKFEFLVDEVSYLLINDETLPVWKKLPDTLYETKDVVREVFDSGEGDTRIEWWEYCEIDNDGATPYSTKEQIAELAALVANKLLGESE